MVDCYEAIDRAERAHAAAVQRLAKLERTLSRRAEAITSDRRDKKRQYGRGKSTWTGADEYAYAECLDELCWARRKEIDGLKAKIHRQIAALAILKQKASDTTASIDGRETALTADEFDQLVDDATHAVNNLIPDAALSALSDKQRSKLLMEINDALTVVLEQWVEKDA